MNKLLLKHQTTLNTIKQAALLMALITAPLCVYTLSATETDRNITNSLNQALAKLTLTDQEAPSLTLTPLQLANINQHQAHIKSAIDKLVTIIDDIEQNRAYWMDKKHHFFAYLFGKNPLKWFKGPSQQAEIEEHCAVLTQKQQTLCNHIGLLRTHQATLTHFSIEPTRFLLNNFQNTIQNTGNNLTKPQNVDAALDAAQECYAVAHQLAKECNYADHLMPSHVTRNWIAYSALSAAACAASIYCYKNPNAPRELLTQAFNYIKTWTHQRIIEPIQSIYERMFREPERPNFAIPRNQNPFITQEAVNLDVESLAQSSRSYILNYHPEIATTQERLAQEVASMQTDSSAVFAADRDAITLGSLFKPGFSNFYLPYPEGFLKVVNIFLITYKQMKHYKNVVSQRVQDLDNAAVEGINLMIQNGINEHQRQKPTLALVAILPTAALAAGAFMATKKILGMCVPHFNYPLYARKYLHAARGLLITPTAHLTPTDEGYLYYWLTQLDKLTTYVPSADREDFSRDINSLMRYELTPSQKVTIIDGMYQRYNFLQHFA